MISYTSFRPIYGYKLVGVIPHKKLIMRHTNPFSSPSDAVRNDLLRKYFDSPNSHVYKANPPG